MRDETSIEECRAAARAAGIPWEWVVQQKNELVRQEAEKRELPNGVRRRAWEATCHWLGWAPSRRRWWTVGFQRCFPRITRNGERDFTSIAKYDVIAESVLAEYPGFAGGDIDDLWDFLLFTRHERWKPRATFYWSALDDILDARGAGAARADAPAEVVPF